MEKEKEGEAEAEAEAEGEGEMVSWNWEMGIQSRGEPPAEPGDRENILKLYTTRGIRGIRAVYTQYIQQHCIYAVSLVLLLVVRYTLRGTRHAVKRIQCCDCKCSVVAAGVRLNERASGDDDDDDDDSVVFRISHFAARSSQLAIGRPPCALVSFAPRAISPAARAPTVDEWRRVRPRVARFSSPRVTSRHSHALGPGRLPRSTTSQRPPAPKAGRNRLLRDTRALLRTAR